MKKFQLFLTTIIMALFMASCQNDDVTVHDIITGIITENDLDGTSSLYWGEGAYISVFPGSIDNIKYELVAGTMIKQGTFYTDIENLSLKGEPISRTVGVSPYNDATTLSISNDLATIRTSVPEEQQFTSNGFYNAGVCPMVGIAENGSDNISFHAAFGAICLKLTGAAMISKVVFTANGGEIINGDVVINANDDGVQSTEISGGTSTITLDCPSGIQLSKQGTDFVVFIPYGSYSQGFTITAYSSEGESITAVADGSINVEKAKLSDIAEKRFLIYTDLNAANTETANCYMITKAGSYYFDATTKGNGSAGIHSTFKDQNPQLDPQGAKLVWEEVDGSITDISYEDGKIYFTASGTPGNALIAATDATGKIIWSWIIWTTTGPEDIPLSNWIFMDRNLGANSIDDYGLYFQWGRKDPFSTIIGFDGTVAGKYHPVDGGAGNGESEKNTIEYSVAHPDTYLSASSRNNDWLLEANQRYLWGVNFEADGLPEKASMKTIYDPCPAGYSVCTPVALRAGIDNGSADNGTYVSLFNGALKIPACGFIFNFGTGWWGQGSFTTLWSCSTSWGNVENAFRLFGNVDAYSNYERSTGAPVRCTRFE